MKLQVSYKLVKYKFNTCRYLVSLLEAAILVYKKVDSLE